MLAALAVTLLELACGAGGIIARPGQVPGERPGYFAEHAGRAREKLRQHMRSPLELLAGIRQTAPKFGDTYLQVKVRPGGGAPSGWKIDACELRSSGRYMLLREVIRAAWRPGNGIRKALI